MRKPRIPAVAAIALACLVSASCSIASIASKALSSGSGSGGSGGALSVFMRDNDPEFVAQALPTLIKTMEALLASEPKDSGLNLTVGSAYIMYANAFIEGPANRLGDDFFEQKMAERSRALNFYKRGSAFVASAIERRFPGVLADSEKAAAAAKKMKKEWVPFLYWYSAGTVAGFALDPMDIPLSMRVGPAKIFMERALELDPRFMGSAISDFFISFHSGVPDSLGGDKSRVEEFYKKSLELNGGTSPGTYIAYAMATAVPAQDSKAFRALMEKALAVKADEHPDSRLMIILSQRSAAHYLAHVSDLILE